jgi:UDP-3-O-[3-hydroxymyristoyl] N-acetylglucosamine deacetylase/3-hydroxyacyl-[acyl-carrier-protein] dehydratase
MDKQRSIAKEVTIKGIGLHTANKVNVTFKPAGIDSGITFIRTDLSGSPHVKMCADNLLSISRSPRRTSVEKEQAEVQTIEHLMAVLSGLCIDNITIELDNNELPGMDGSSLNFLEAINKAGIVQQDKERHFFALKEPIFVEEPGACLIAVPASEFKISYTLDYNHPFLKSQYLEIGNCPGIFQREIASARTFCLEEEVGLQREGFGRGANYENTLVVGKNGVIKNSLRFQDEFIRHKILDLMGDLYCLGYPLKAHIIAIKSGHSLNLKIVKKIDEQRNRLVSGGISCGYQPQIGEELDVSKIKMMLPHREPFLFIDKIICLEPAKRAKGIKNVTINDYFFKGHFPARPVMPGVLIIEAMAQVGGVMMLAPEENKGKLAFFMAINNVKFRKTVVPGDQLVLEVEAGRIKSKTGQVFGKAFVDGKIVVEAELMFALVEG